MGPFLANKLIWFTFIRVLVTAKMSVMLYLLGSYFPGLMTDTIGASGPGAVGIITKTLETIKQNN